MNERIREKIAELHRIEAEYADLRREWARMTVEDYALTASDGTPVRLSSLFGDNDHLLLIHNMGFSCSYCTMWADGFNAVLPHIEERSAFVVATPDPPATQHAGRQERGWRFPMVSFAGSTLNHDLGFEPEPGLHHPGVSALIKDPSGSIRRYSADMFGPGDKYCSVWNLVGLFPQNEQNDM